MPNVLGSTAHPAARPARRRRDWRSFRLLAPALLLLVIFFLLPVLSLLLHSILEPTLGLQNYTQLLGSTTYLRVFGNTFLVATVVTVATVAIGFPTAWLLAIAPRKVSSLLFSILLLSMWTNLLARTFAWMVLLQATGPINRTLTALGLIHEPLALVNNLIGVTIGMTYIMLPFLVMPLHATLRSIDPSTLRAAAVCGASRWQAFWRVLARAGAAGDARDRIGCADGVRHGARLLRDPCIARRAFVHDAGRTDRAARAVTAELGTRGCRRFRAAGRDALVVRAATPFHRQCARKLGRTLTCFSISTAWAGCAGR